MPNKKEILKKTRVQKMDRPSREELGAVRKKIKKITYPSRSTYQGDGGLMRLTGGVLPFEYSSDSRDMDHKQIGDPVSAAKQTELEKYREALKEFFKNED